MPRTVKGNLGSNRSLIGKARMADPHECLLAGITPEARNRILFLPIRSRDVYENKGSEKRIPGKSTEVGEKMDAVRATFLPLPRWVEYAKTNRVPRGEGRKKKNILSKATKCMKTLGRLTKCRDEKAKIRRKSGLSFGHFRQSEVDFARNFRFRRVIRF